MPLAFQSRSVILTDIDPRFIPASELGHLEVVHHDVTTDEIPADRYDLIHAGLVLSHLPQRGDVTQRLIQALRPGGWPSAGVMEAGLRQVGDRMIAAGLVDRPALDEAIAYLTVPTSIISMPTMVSAWGRRQ